ncbi:MAG: recombinase family protein [Elainellaceae cyanobacterium]
MSSDSIWIVGSTRSGKTHRLIDLFSQRARSLVGSVPLATDQDSIANILVMAANGDNRIELADRIHDATAEPYRFDSTTPLGFFESETRLFWPLIAQQLGLQAQFPLRLRPETEQELATRLWQPELTSGRLQQEGVRDYYLVRRTLDLLQLSGSAGIPLEDIPILLKDGFADQIGSADLWDCMGEVLQHWWHWCLDRGLVTYGIISQLYWRYLLPNETYQQHVRNRYYAVFADDVDEYPAIARSLLTVLLDAGRPGVFTYNPEGGHRLGLGADSHWLEGLASRCRVESLDRPRDRCLASDWSTVMWAWVQEPLRLSELPDSIQTIQTVSRAQLLRQTAEAIATAVYAGQVQPHEVAVVGPGLDAIARYTLREILIHKGISVEALNDQRTLISSPMIRALLTLMALLYPGLGRLINREAIAEMLVMLSQAPVSRTEPSGLDLADIDPVRAGLITDHCFKPDPTYPELLPITAFPRWDRLGYRASQTYSAIAEWIDRQRADQQQRLIPNAVTVLDRAIQQFFYGGSHLPYDQLAALRELIETAQHYWDIDTRLRRSDLSESPPSSTVENFINLLRSGTITADPYPVRPVGMARQSVTLATIFQYRSQRQAHRWQFWLDAGSALWLMGGGPLFGAPLFLREWSGRSWTADDTAADNQERLRREMVDLLGRATERIYLCHSELATNGQEQTGPLLSLVNAAPSANAL